MSSDFSISSDLLNDTMGLVHFEKMHLAFCTGEKEDQGTSHIGFYECESSRYSRVIHLGRKSCVDEEFGVFSLVLGQTHTDSKFLLGMSIEALAVKVACK